MTLHLVVLWWWCSCSVTLVILWWKRGRKVGFIPSTETQNRRFKKLNLRSKKEMACQGINFASLCMWWVSSVIIHPSPCGNPVLKRLKLFRNVACWLDNGGPVSLGKDEVQICQAVDQDASYERQLIKTGDCRKVCSVMLRGRGWFVCPEEIVLKNLHFDRKGRRKFIKVE